MKRSILLALLAFSIAQNLFSQTIQTANKAQEPFLLGKTSIDALRTPPYSEWFTKNFDNYSPNSEVLAKQTTPDLKRLVAQSTVKIFFGTWCGDSKREVPRFLKVAQMLGLKEEQIELIGVDKGDSTMKRSPSGEEKGYDIFRVPTFIVLQNGKEFQRITEYPAESHERDLVKIFNRQPYLPNYFSYSHIREWLQTGVLADSNVSVAALASHLRRIAPVSYEGELNGCAYVLLSRNQVREAVNVLRINATLFPQSSNCWESLAEGYERLGNKSKAIHCCERALELDAKNAVAMKRLIKLQTL